MKMHNTHMAMSKVENSAQVLKSMVYEPQYKDRIHSTSLSSYIMDGSNKLVRYIKNARKASLLQNTLT